MSQLKLFYMYIFQFLFVSVSLFIFLFCLNYVILIFALNLCPVDLCIHVQCILLVCKQELSEDSELACWVHFIL